MRCRVEISDMDRVLNDVVAVVIGGAVGDSRLDARPRHPDAEAARVVVTPGQRRLPVALPRDAAAELAAPDHQGVFQQARDA